MQRNTFGYVAVFLATLVTAPLAAQDWYLGVEGGVNISDISLDYIEVPLLLTVSPAAEPTAPRSRSGEGRRAPKAPPRRT